MPKSKAADSISVGAAAKLLMISTRRVNQLAAGKWIARPYTTTGVVQGYLKFQRDGERKRSRTVGEEDIRRERARKLKLENDETERMLIRSDDVLAAMDFIVGRIKADLASVAPRVTDDAPLRRKIEDGIDAALHGLADRFEKAGTDLLAGRDVFAAGAEDEPEPVGAAEQDLPAIV